MGMARGGGVRLLVLLLLGLAGSNGGRCSGARTTRLPEQEVEALKGIATKLNKTDWDFSVDPCSASGNWANSTGFIISNVTCDCSFKNNTECHIIRLELMRQNLSGVLPDEVVNLTYLRYLDLSRNFIQGPIPASWGDLPVYNLYVLHCHHHFVRRMHVGVCPLFSILAKIQVTPGKSYIWNIT